MSATRADSSSLELVREAISFLISLVELLTTLLEDALSLAFGLFAHDSCLLLAFDNVRMTHIASS